MENISTRFKKYVENKGLMQKEVEAILGLTNGHLGKIFKTESPSPKILDKIYVNFPDLNKKWLIFNEGEMLLDEDYESAKTLYTLGKGNPSGYDFSNFIKNDEKVLNFYNQIKNEDEVAESQEPYGKDIKPDSKPIPVNKGVPIYDFDFAAGLSMFSTNDIQLSEHILGYMNFPEFMGADAIVKIKGDSMTGKLEDGDWVTVRKQKSVDIINYGSIYGIITTDDMPLIKIIRKGSTDDTVLLRSNNPEYEDYEIPKAKIQP